jgi:hypothetical protein
MQWQLICCFARERVDRDKGGRPPDDADRPRSRSSGRALRYNPSALTQPREFSDAKLIRKFGDVPDDLSAL